MGLKNGTIGIAINPPGDFMKLMFSQELIRFKSDTKNTYDYVHIFVESVEEFNNLFDKVDRLLNTNGVLWITFPSSYAFLKENINLNLVFNNSTLYNYIPEKSISFDDYYGISYKKTKLLDK